MLNDVTPYTPKKLIGFGRIGKMTLKMIAENMSSSWRRLSYTVVKAQNFVVLLVISRQTSPYFLKLLSLKIQIYKSQSQIFEEKKQNQKTRIRKKKINSL